MPGLFDFAKTVGGIFSTRSRSQEAQEDAVETDFGPNRAGGAAVVEDEVRDTPRKRARESEEQGRGVNKKSKRAAGEDDDYRLLGRSERVPRDAVTIAIPTNLSSDGEQPSVSQPAPRMATKPRPARSSHRMMNNLNDDRPGKSLRAARLGAPPQPNGTTRSRPLSSMLGSSQVDSGDGFERHELGRPAKKTKTTHLPLGMTPKPAPDVVDLVDDDDSQPPVVSVATAVNGKRPASTSHDSPGTHRSNSQTKHDDFFHPSEIRGINQYIRPTHEKPRRRQRVGREGEESSSRSSLSRNGSTGHEVSRPVTRQRPHSVTDDETTRHRNFPPTARSAPSHRPSSSVGLPPIDLGKGLDDVQTAKNKTSMNLANNVMSKHVNSLSNLKGRTLTNATKQQQPERLPSQSPNPTGDSNLRGKFVRDTSISAPRQERTRMRQGMQEQSHARSHGSPSYDSSGSPDQLLGETNVRSGISGKARLSPEVEVTPSRKRSSPSNLKAGLHNISQKPHTKPSPARPKDGPDVEGYKCWIRQIYCRGCVSNRPDTCLVWDNDLDGFCIQHNGKSQQVAGKTKCAVIGTHEAKTWQGNPNSLKVVIKGSVTECSNGFLLVEFADPKSLHKCLNQLMDASKDTMTVNASAQSVEAIFNKQMSGVQADAAKYAKKMLRAAEEEELEHTRRQQARLPSRADDEEIRYETEDQVDVARSCTASKRIKGNVGPMESPYWSNESSTRRSARDRKPTKPRSPTPEPERWTRIHKPAPWNQSVLFPAQGVRRVTVDFQDLERLDEGEFLNDNLVGYAMRKIEQSMSPEVKSQVHFFNTYFFTSLTSSRGRSINYDAVKKWTKQTDLFDTPYVVVPINASLHWYVAIICNLPNIQRKPVSFEAADFSANATPSKPPTPAERSSPPLATVIDDSQDAEANNKSESEAMKALSISDEEKPSGNADGYTFGDDDHVVEAKESAEAQETSARPKGKAGKKGKKKPAMRSYDPHAPAIIMLDSFGTSRGPETRQLKDYLIAEADSKRGMQVERDEIQGLTAKGIPEQTNMHDCGVYLLGYVEQFAKDPRKFVEKVLTRDQDWESDFASFKPSEKRAELRDQLLALYHEQDEAKKESKRQKKAQKGTVSAQGAATASAALAPPSSSAPAQPAGAVSEPSSPVATPLPEKLPWAPQETSVQPSSPEKADSHGNDSAVPMPRAGLAYEESQGEELEFAPLRALPGPDAQNRADQSEPQSALQSRGTKLAPPNGSDEDPMLDYDPKFPDTLTTAHNVDATPLDDLERELSAGLSPRHKASRSVTQSVRSSP